jgi:diguanylate cyclase (GGDEF)-like protein/PAS domain S-box-containing protein
MGDAVAAGARFPDDPAPVPTPERLARTWARAVEDTSFVPMDRPTLVAFLRPLATDLLAALAADRFDRSVPLRVGTALVDAHFTETGSIERTLARLGHTLAGTPGAAERLPLLLGGIAAGYARALQDRTRREQERISASAFAARTAAEQARWDSEVRFRTVFAEAVIGIGLADTAGMVLEVNHALADMLGLTQEALRGEPIWTFVHPDDVPGLWERTKELLAGERNHLRVDKAYYRPDGTEVWTNLVLSLIRDPHGTPQYMVAMMENITERHRLQTRLQHQALHDPLTDLPNRTLFFERLDAALRAGTQPGVCYLDLDGFKAVNDTLGHDRGDRLLRAIARRLIDTVGAEHLVARMGGDEFVVLVETPHPGEGGYLRRVARSALDAVRRPVRLDDNEISITASVGVVQADGSQDAAELMKAADTTLYWAKADGRDRYALFDEARHRSDVDRFEVSARMPDALTRGAFSLEYQPLVRLADRAAVGVEALLRWTLPDGTRLDPGRFVPLAEDSGFIVPLGRWILEQACRSAAAWAAADPALQPLISVNVAARQVREPAFVDDVAAVLAQTGRPPELLQLELTESALMGTPDESPAALHALADMGVRIAIDDFGTGYSNLAYLRRLPVHALKLAGSFVTGATGRDGDAPDPGADVDREVVGLVIKLAHTLGLTVTAESVETPAQFAHLQQLGCDTGQGWLFAAPVPAERIPELLARPLGTPPSASAQ